MDVQEARLRAEKNIDASWLIITGVEEYDVGWVFFYDSVAHQQSGDFRDSVVGNAPILVDRENGSVHSTGTARPIEEYIERYRHRDPEDERSWHP